MGQAGERERKLDVRAVVILGASLSLLMLALLPGDVWKAWVNDSLSAPTSPTKRERGLLGVGAMPRLPPSPPSRGTGHPPNGPTTEQSPAWPLGPADPSSIPPGLGESLWLAHCPTPATFPLPHCSCYQHPPRSAAAQESVAAAWAAAEAGRQGPGVLLAGAASTGETPRPVPESWLLWHAGAHGTGPCSLCVSPSSVLEVGGRRPWAQL